MSNVEVKVCKGGGGGGVDGNVAKRLIFFVPFMFGERTLMGVRESLVE